MKKHIIRGTIAIILIFVLMAAVAPTVAFAGQPDPPPGNSKPGLDRYLETASNPNPNAQCGTGAGSGAFGYLGKGVNPGDPSWDGGNGTDPGTTAQTGLNNSAVCGHRP